MMMLRLQHALAITALTLGSGAAVATQPTSTDEARAGVAAVRATPDDRTAGLQRHVQAMTKGKDHQGAIDETCGAKNGAAMGELGRRHAEAMSRGADHEAARDAATRE